MGRSLNLAKTPALARPLFIEAWTLATETGDDVHAIEAAQMMAMIERPKIKIEWTNRAIELAEKSKQQEARNCLGALYMTVGWHYFELRSFDKTLDYFQRALNALEKELGSSNTNVTIIKQIIVAKYSIGKVYRVMHRFEEALKLQQELLAELDSSGRKDGNVYEEIAECFAALKKPSDAEFYFGQAYLELLKDQFFVDNHAARLRRLKDLGKIK
jgi:tetratricopeptide (TPR) repeat protein